MADDFIQKFEEALDAAIDSHPSVIAITGRDRENIVAGDSSKEIELPLYAYDFVAAPELAADQDTRDVRVQISADADDRATINEMLGVLERILDQPLFLSLATPLDVQVANRLRVGNLIDYTFRVTQQLAA